MKSLDPDRMQAAFNEHEAELTIMRNLLIALVDSHPSRQKIVDAFRRETEGYCKTAPVGTDQEYLVEVRARLQIYLQLLAMP